MDILPEELELAIERERQNTDRVVKSEGYGAHPKSLAVIQSVIDKFVADLAERVEHPDRRYTQERQLLAVLRTELPTEVLALAMLQAFLHTVALGRTYTKCALSIGKAIHGELWAAGLAKVRENRKRRDGAEYSANVAKDIEAYVRSKHGNTKYRRRVADNIATKMGYDGPKWDEEHRLRAGHWALTMMLELLPDVFMLEEGPRQQVFPTLTPEADAAAEQWVGEMTIRNPVWIPKPEAPPPWTDLYTGGASDERLTASCTLLRARKKQQRKAASTAIHAGEMDRVLQAVNALQAVPWTINERVLGVMHECMRRGFPIKGLPNAQRELPAKPADWDDLAKLERDRWKRQLDQTKKANRRFRGDRTRFLSSLKTADRLAEDERYYTAMNLDWRGRVYAMPHFNYQREDYTRSLFLFAEGQPLTDDGMYWLKAQVASVGEFEGVHKKPFSDRVQWTDDNMDLIRAAAEVPMADHRWWEAKKPWLFLAACQELTSCLSGSERIVRLPVAYDASASGLQHLCAMTRSEEGALVNLTPSHLPRDVYAVVAERMLARVRADLTNEDTRQIAQTWLDYFQLPYAETPRAVCKRNVMTYAYSSKVFGMGKQHCEDLMDPLTLDVILGKIPEHPFGPDRGREAAKYIARHIYTSIEEVVKRPAQAMEFLQKIARALAHESKPVRWTTPCGLPWINAYNVPITKRVKLWLHDKGSRIKYVTKLAVGDKREINKEKAAQAVSPNFVHALDGSHLLRTVVAASNAGIQNLATVHDSFGCLPNDALRFRRIIREEFARLYTEHDVLNEVYEQALADIDDKERVRAIAIPAKGPANVEEVLNSDFAFA